VVHEATPENDHGQESDPAKNRETERCGLMRRMKRTLCLLLACILLASLTGCWNYREVDRMDIVAGVAVDKGTSARYKITIEIIDITHDNELRPRSKIISAEGESMFDAARNAIAIGGKRLYWSHAKVIIISQVLAKDGIVKIIDWYSRDSETRTDVRLLISGEDTASEIFTDSVENSDIKSVTMHEILKNEKNLSKAPDIEIWRFVDKLASPGVSPIAAVIKLKEENGKKIPEINGSAIFRQDRLIGFIDGEETLDMQMILNKLEGGVLVQNEQAPEGESIISLEIFENKTKIEPMIETNHPISINIKTKTDVAIDEIEGPTNFMKDGLREQLIEDIEETLRNDLEAHIKYVQSEFGTDIFGFGNKIYKEYPEVWKELSQNWPVLFKDLTVTVDCTVTIRNSAMHAETLTIGD
jgi:spore germination protein KC